MQVPSVVFVRRGGEIVVGEAAEQQGAAEPSRVVREFKRRIGDSVPGRRRGAVLGAGADGAVAGLGRRVATERQGGPPEHVCVTHPANWGPFKRDLLGQAVEMAGLRNVEMCTEPEAAAITYASRNRVGRRRPGRGLRPGRGHVRRGGAGARRRGVPAGRAAGGRRAAGRDRLRRGRVPARADVAGTGGRGPRRHGPGDRDGAGPAPAGLRRGQGGAVVQHRHGGRWGCPESPGRSG